MLVDGVVTVVVVDDLRFARHFTGDPGAVFFRAATRANGEVAVLPPALLQGAHQREDAQRDGHRGAQRNHAAVTTLGVLVGVLGLLLVGSAVVAAARGAAAKRQEREDVLGLRASAIDEANGLQPASRRTSRQVPV